MIVKQALSVIVIRGVLLSPVFLKIFIKFQLPSTSKPDVNIHIRLTGMNSFLQNHCICIPIGNQQYYSYTNLHTINCKRQINFGFVIV